MDTIAKKRLRCVKECERTVDGKGDNAGSELQSIDTDTLWGT